MVDAVTAAEGDTGAVAAPDAAAVAATPAPAAAESAPAVETPFLHTDTPSLLETVAAPGTAPAAPVEPAPAAAAIDTAKPAEAAPVEAPPVEPAPALEPITYAFELPELLKADDPKIAEFTSILGDARIAPEVGQKILNMYGEAAQAYARHVADEGQRAFANYRAENRKQIQADPEFGGAAFDTASGAIARMRDMFVPEKDQAAFNEMLTTTGVGDHPSFWRMLYRVANAFDEPSSAVPVGKPPPDNGVRPGRTARREALYDNPRSHPNGRGG